MSSEVPLLSSDQTRSTFRLGDISGLQMIVEDARERFRARHLAGVGDRS